MSKEATVSKVMEFIKDNIERSGWFVDTSKKHKEILRDLYINCDSFRNSYCVSKSLNEEQEKKVREYLNQRLSKLAAVLE